MDLTLRDETIALAARLTFVRTGGPVLVIPEVIRRAWRGTGKGDYDRASAAKTATIEVGPGRAIVLDREAAAFLRRPDGSALIVFWIGADAAAHVLQAVLSAPAHAWSKTGETFVMTGTALAFADAAKTGRAAALATYELAEGRYAIERMREYRGRIRVGRTRHDVMASALRLRPQAGIADDRGDGLAEVADSEVDGRG